MSSVSIIERLQHLMSFGSHIVLVSSPSAAESASLASNIIVAQEESAELVIIKTKKDDLANKRELLHQLSSGTITATTDSLWAQSQGYIDQGDFPSMFFLLQGENGSNHFYQEICSLYSKVNACKKAANVIIFVPADSLPRVSQLIKSYGQDSVIIEQQIDSLAAQDSSELNALIAENRARLAKRIAQRNMSEDNQDVLPSDAKNVSKSFLVMACMILFLAVFVGLLWLVYDDDEDNLQTAVVSNDSQAVKEISVEQDNQAILRDAADVGNEDVDTSNHDNARVTNWASAVNRMDNTKTTAENVPDVELVAVSNVVDDDMPFLETTKVDAFNKEQPLADMTPPISSAVVSDTTIPQADKANVINNKKKLLSNKKLLQKLSDTEYVIQLAAMTDPEVRARFISSHALLDKVWQYTTQREGIYWYVVLANQAYPSAAAARQKIASYSQDVFTSTPFVKSVSVVKKELL